MKLKTLTVSQVSDYISNHFETNPIFSSIVVKGEVFNLRKTGYGYTFLSLKDEESKLNALSFLDKIDFKEGDVIVARGKIQFYKKHGTYSLIIKSYEKSGLGGNYEQFKKLYAQLEKLGYFEEKRKKALSWIPQKIGIITSEKGAAVKDILSVIERRFPKVTVYINNAKMQGADVEEGIIRGIEKLNEKEVDTIIISRGGGDSDDLGVFNSKAIADAIINSKVPIISAIGHEIDYVICDFVADKRAATPSIAGELSVPKLQDVENRIEEYKRRIESSYKLHLKQNLYLLGEYKIALKKNSPYQKILQKKMKIKTTQLVIGNLYKSKIQIYKNKLVSYQNILQENNYDNILSKGFVLVKKDDVFLRGSEGIQEEDRLTICFKDAHVDVEVKKIDKI